MNDNVLSEVTETMGKLVPLALGTLFSAVTLHIFNNSQRGAIFVGFDGIRMEFDKSTKYLKGE